MGLFSKKETIEVREDEFVEGKESEDVLLEILLNNNSMTKEKALNTPAVAASINRISDVISSLPIKLYKNVGEDVEEVLDDDRLKLLNYETGDALDANQMKRRLVVDYFLGKGGYIYINRIGNTIRSLHYVDEEEISFLTNEDPIFKDYKILVRGKQYQDFQFVKILRNTKNGYDSISIVKENEVPFMLGYQTALFEKIMLESGGNKKGFLQANKKLSREAMQMLKGAFRNLYSNNKENVVVLNDGLTFKESSNSCTELQLSENKISNNNNILKIFNIPPSIINGNATSNDERIFLTNCIIPILRRFETAFNKELLLEDEKGVYFFSFDISDIEKADIEKRYQAYEIASKEGFMQIDEIRKKEKLPKLDLDFVKLGLQDVLYDPSTKKVFTPNTGLMTDLTEADSLVTEQNQVNTEPVVNDTEANIEGGGEADEN